MFKRKSQNFLQRLSNIRELKNQSIQKYEDKLKNENLNDPLRPRLMKKSKTTTSLNIFTFNNNEKNFFTFEENATILDIRLFKYLSFDMNIV